MSESPWTVSVTFASLPPWNSQLKPTVPPTARPSTIPSPVRTASQALIWSIIYLTNPTKNGTLGKGSAEARPWEWKMSLCISAVAEFKSGHPKIVCCFDQKISTEQTSAETEMKADFLPHNLLALFAGTVSRAKEVLDIYRDKLRAVGAKTFWADSVEMLREPPRILKRRMLEAYCQARLGITYERLLSAGASELDPALRRKMLSHISDQNTDVQLIICGFDTTSDNPRIFKFDWDEMTEVTQFACIGTGATGAEHALYRRSQHNGMEVKRTLYNVW